MEIAFYAPMKPPGHPIPSGERQMARLLVKALTLAGHRVDIVSEMRSYVAQPHAEWLAATMREAENEIARLSERWAKGSRPDLWFCYHPYYKAPDLIGPRLAAAFAIPYVTAEASYSFRRNIGVWAEAQRLVAEAVKRAALNICFTRRDRDGLLAIAPQATLEMLPPFIDRESDTAVRPRGGGKGARLIAVAMMRRGDKLDSYVMLAQALGRITHLPWTMSIVGDGPCRTEVETAFAGLPRERIDWLGVLDPESVPAALREADIYVWPGCGEAYGLAYLEAQAAGLPVVAQNTAGVPEVVRDSLTGILTPAGNVAAFAAAIERLLTDEAERQRMADAAHRFVADDCSLEAAAARLAAILPKVTA
ncbi:glycosyltransferase family 1 protein [Pseudaminobacter arsenicus]|uniref:Glycosyltransferase family 1 protein n=1 Tax=Borborobacter arsenicus TaxID=1851146 RepID=A0A432V9W8_9HYPH|nr:glycosyltransferase family 4 protein [Pseudaminobacter arsenicus]RUM98944.1 glycosyltransferase family 1 protein [Pseudaminobacter arsenicus]